MLKGSETVKQWSSPQVPVHFTIYMFNLTNKDEFMKGEKPKIEEVGPFVYKSVISQHNAYHTVLVTCF